MNSHTKNLLWPIAIAVAALILSSVAVWNVSNPTEIQQLGVTNLDSLHLSDNGGTATPVLLVNQDGTGVIAEFRDAGTPIAQFLDGHATAGLVIHLLRAPVPTVGDTVA